MCEQVTCVRDVGRTATGAEGWEEVSEVRVHRLKRPKLCGLGFHGHIRIFLVSQREVGVCSQLRTREGARHVLTT